MSVFTLLFCQQGDGAIVTEVISASSLEIETQDSLAIVLF